MNPTPAEAAATLQLVLVPSPGAGHVFPMVELANQLLNRYPALAVTVCIMKMPFKSTSFDFATYKSSHVDRIKFIDLDPPTLDPNTPPSKRFSSFLEGHAPQVKKILSEHVAASNVSPSVVLDMFCTSFMADAKELGVPSYVFYTFSATFLGLMFQLQALYDEGRFNPVQIKDSDTEFVEISSLKTPIPGNLLPSAVVEPDLLLSLITHTRRTKEYASGILINTFQDFESHAIASLNAGQSQSQTPPPIYPVGPIMELKVKDADHSAGPIMEWLDQQPESSVVFLCFGSMGSFDEEQVNEIAAALEKSGCRFIWSLRRPPPKSGGVKFPTDYEDVTEALPAGFLDRTRGVGKVIGWAPQTMILAHPSTGGFVSHCGWNSVLESMWFGVPVATWPMYAEQQLNAVLLVRELEMAEEIRMSYRKESGEVIKAEEIEKGIMGLMSEESGGERRKKTKEMSEKSRKTVENGGASYHSIGRFVGDD
uniref:Glycosyltransferase n=1 Tax=Linum usitatissimum TaxID=4006 RepID=I2BH18_LINUS|nr:UDP-glycosyltransferase 1 [Linum usitatissimum]